MDVVVEDYLAFMERSFGDMLAATRRVGDELVNERPDLPGANSPYGLVHHSVGAVRWWLVHNLVGLPVDRTRDVEFTAQGTIADLESEVEALLIELRDLGPKIDSATELAHEAETSMPYTRRWTPGAVAIHAYEEVAQHLGHLEITVDLLLNR